MTSHAKPDRNIPSLDGLRAISIAMVLALHTLQRASLTHPVPFFGYVLFNGALGVRIFFVISGYLITRLLLREFEQKGTISLGRFYIRRAFRILPPLYTYIAFLGVLAAFGKIVFSKQEMFSALFFYRNYNPHAALWALEHTWSLCIEEQFYLLWPALLVWSLLKWRGVEGRVIAARIALVAIALSPIIRVASYRSHWMYLHNPGMFQMDADPIMFGCVAALLEGHAMLERIYNAVMRWPWLTIITTYLVFGTLEMRFQNYWNFPLGITLSSLLLACILLWLVRNPLTPTGRLLNHTLMRWFGVLSYSLYLWQTFFLHSMNEKVFGGRFFWNTFPGNWLAILLAATASFYLVERPALRLRDMLMRQRSPI